jgi:hypothetical protein
MHIGPTQEDVLSLWCRGSPQHISAIRGGLRHALQLGSAGDQGAAVSEYKPHGRGPASAQ